MDFVGTRTMETVACPTHFRLAIGLRCSIAVVKPTPQSKRRPEKEEPVGFRAPRQQARLLRRLWRRRRSVGGMSCAQEHLHARFASPVNFV